MPAALPHIPLRLWIVAIVTGSGAFMAMLDSTVTNLAVEPIGRAFDAPLLAVQWIATGYLIALAVVLPLTGWLGRRFGSGRIWQLSTLCFIGASVSCALAPNLDILTLSRCFQGLGAGLMVPTGQAILASCTNQRQLGRLMGTVGFAIALGPALGPALGGYLTDAASWRWIFWINIPIGLAAIFASRSILQPNEPKSNESLDWKGLSLIAIGLPILFYSAAEIGAEGLTKTTIACLAIGACLISAFVWHSRFCESPLVDIGLLHRPGLTAACSTAALTGAAMYGGLLLLPLYLQQSLGMTTTNAGFMLVILGLGSAIVLPIAGALSDRYGPTRVCVGGGLLLLFGTAPFVSAQNIPVMMIAALFLLRGAGLALAQMPAITAAYGAVATTEKGDAAVLINVAQRVGGALGAVAVVIAAETTFASDGADNQWAFAFLTLLAAAALATGMKLSK